MRAHLDAIHQEYAKQRIKGSDYSKVYLGGMQAAMSQAVAFALGKDEAAAKAELAKYEILKVQAAINLIFAQVCETEKKIELLQAQREMTAAQTWAEIAKTDNDIDARMRELLGIDANNVALPDGPDYSGPAGLDNTSLIGAQVEKINAEEDLLVHKMYSELAQVEDHYKMVGAKEIPVTGIIGKNKNLLQRQADGFLRDAEAKIAKIATDAFAVQYSTLDGVSSEEWGWNAPDLFTMLENAYENMANASFTGKAVPDSSVEGEDDVPKDFD